MAKTASLVAVFYNYRMWASELICIFSGARKGELLVKKVNGRDTKKDCKISDVQMSKDYIQIFRPRQGNTKTTANLRGTKRSGTDCGTFWPTFSTFFKILKTIICTVLVTKRTPFRSQEPHPYYLQPVLEKNYRRRHPSQACPPGTIGGHGGRIRLATLLDIRNVNEVDIKGRGRWSSKCWQIYVRMFTEYYKSYKF